MRSGLAVGICGLVLCAAACTSDTESDDETREGGTVDLDATEAGDNHSATDDDDDDDEPTNDDDDDAPSDDDDAPSDDDDAPSDDDDAPSDDDDAPSDDDDAPSDDDDDAPTDDDDAPSDDDDDDTDDLAPTDDDLLDDSSDDDDLAPTDDDDDSGGDDGELDASVPTDDGGTDDSDASSTTDDETTDDETTDDTSVDDSTQPIVVDLIVTSANALGTVTVNGQPCEDSRCTVELIAGDMVTIAAIAGRSMVFTEWVSALGQEPDCSAAECTFTIEEEMTRMDAHFSSPHNLMFVTNYVNAYALGGLEGADDVCAQTADNAGLGGIYRAWLSSATIDAKDRLDGARGWVRIDGYPIADTADDWAAARSLMPVAYNASGDRQEHMFWTGTNSAGELGGNRPFYYEDEVLDPGSCGDWGELDPPLADGGRPPEGAAVGSATGIGVRLSDTTTIDCDGGAGLLCMGVDKTAPLSFEPSSGRIAFLSDALVAANDGIAAADAICQTEGAGLGGSFLAALATSTTPLWERFDLDGAPWVRVDGIPFVTNASDLADSHEVLTGLNVRANGELVVSYASTDTFALTGGDSASDLDPEQTCQDWSVSGGADNTMFGGDPQSGSDNSLGCCRSGCTQERRVFCLQE